MEVLFTKNDLRTLYTAFLYELPADHDDSEKDADSFLTWIEESTDEELNDFLNACKGA